MVNTVYNNNNNNNNGRQELAKQLRFLEEPYSPCYKYELLVFLENDKYKLRWDHSLLTDKTVRYIDQT